MPGNSSSKKSRQKRLQVTDTAGWTHIVRGSQAQKNQKYLTPVNEPRPTQVPKGLTVQKACDKLERYRKAWGESIHNEQLKEILERQVLGAGTASINRCVCLGLGSMTGTSSDESSWYQLAILMSVLEILGTKHPIENIYVQDPMFNHIDIALLESLGYTLLETPDAFQYMTINTFLFDPHVDWRLTVKALNVADPCLRIGNMILDDISMSKHMTAQEKESEQRYAREHFETAMPSRWVRWSFMLGIFWPRPSKPEERSGMIHDRKSTIPP